MKTLFSFLTIAAIAFNSQAFAQSSEIGEYARVIVDDGDTNFVQIKNMIEMKSNGGKRVITSRNTHSGNTYLMTHGFGDDFRISLAGTGGPEFRIDPNGRVTFGPGAAKNVIMQPWGDVEVLGTVIQLSDRNQKENFVAIDRQKILNEVMQLPLSKWNYKSNKSDKHIGPMAQDFYKAFGLGKDELTIASVDMNGITIAAVQALYDRTQSLEAKLKEREQQLEELSNELDTRVSQLEITLQNQPQ